MKHEKKDCYKQKGNKLLAVPSVSEIRCLISARGIKVMYQSKPVNGQDSKEQE